MTKEEQAQRKANTINQAKIDAMLKKKYGQNKAQGNMSRTVYQLYKEYQSKLQKPILNKYNLIKVMHYIKKHNTKQKDYDKVLGKLQISKAKGLSYDDFTKIYKKVAKDCGAGVSYPEAKKVINGYLDMIWSKVKSGKKVRLGRLGHLDLRHTEGRHYNNRFGHGKTAPHNYPHFTASTVFKRDVK